MATAGIRATTEANMWEFLGFMFIMAGLSEISTKLSTLIELLEKNRKG